MENYILLILLGFCVSAHIWMMFKGYGHGDGHKGCGNTKDNQDERVSR